MFPSMNGDARRQAEKEAGIEDEAADTIESLRAVIEAFLKESETEFGPLDGRLADQPDSFDKAEAALREAVRE